MKRTGHVEKQAAGYASAHGERYAVAAGSSEAAAAASSCLDSGGNIVDAAISASAVLCVVLPQAVSLGGDLFALIRLGAGSEVLAVNASGPAPQRATIEAYHRRGHARVPAVGALSIESPGLVAGWETLHRRWGSRPLSELLEPAVDLARNGSRVGRRLASAIAANEQEHRDLPGWGATFLSGGRPLAENDRLLQPGLAGTLERIAQHGAQGFYHGPVARDIVRTVNEAGGLLTEADLAAVRAEVLKPLRLRYRGLEVLTQPPVSQGIVLLRALQRMQAETAEPGALPEAELWLRAAQALRQAFRERLALLGDAPNSQALAEGLLESGCEVDSPAGLGFAAHPDSDTTCLAVMDTAGNAAAVIQSVYGDLGSGIVAEASGVLLNNRLSGFFLDATHPNALAPGRRTMHTLHTFIAQDGVGVRWAGGSPGGDHQPQINLQVLLRLIDLGQETGPAVEAPRWATRPGTDPQALAEGTKVVVECEPGVTDQTLQRFSEAGLQARRDADVCLGSSKLVGRGALPGAVAAWSDHRREGHVIAQ
jgi:gamma-glutamyltranspeptidase/glutathione hydrolase